MSQGAIAKMLLEPTVFSSLKKHPNHYGRFVQMSHILFQLTVFFYKKYRDREEWLTRDRKEWLLKTAVNSLANLANVKKLLTASVLIFLLGYFKNYLGSLGPTSFFWSASVAVLVMISHFPFWGNIALR